MTEPTTGPATSTELAGGIALVRVSGSLDSGPDQAVAAELDAVFEKRPGSVVLDLSPVDFMGSAGIALLINTRHRAARLGVAFAIVADNRCVLRPLQLSQVDGTLPLHPTLDEAVAAVRLAST